VLAGIAIGRVAVAVADRRAKFRDAVREIDLHLVELVARLDDAELGGQGGELQFGIALRQLSGPNDMLYR